MIRAYGREKEFEDRGNELLNKITLANQVTAGVFSWYSFRMNILVFFLLGAGCTFSVLMRESANQVLLGMML